MGIRLKSWYSNRQKVYFRYSKNSMTSLNYYGRNDIFNAFLNDRERGEGKKKELRLFYPNSNSHCKVSQVSEK